MCIRDSIYAYGFSRYHHIGGQGATMPLALFMLRAKSKKYRVLGKATLVPSIFNINEPLQYGAVVGNPFMLIPTVMIAIILPAFSYLWFVMGWEMCIRDSRGGIHCQNSDDRRHC